MLPTILITTSMILSLLAGDATVLRGELDSRPWIPLPGGSKATPPASPSLPAPATQIPQSPAVEPAPAPNSAAPPPPPPVAAAPVAPVSPEIPVEPAPVAAVASETPPDLAPVWKIQIAALSNLEAATKEKGRLEKILGPGTLVLVEENGMHKIRWGNFPSREAADAARVDLKSFRLDGFPVQMRR
ncbi:MAG: SPOR domain-containing protein [Fibrobacteria bacterium]|nr:SPOR domain-containing protein [Fibrobacteria bacterium]